LTEQKNGLVSYSSTIFNEKGTMMKQKKLGIAGLMLVLFTTFFAVNVSADKPNSGSGIEVLSAIASHEDVYLLQDPSWQTSCGTPLAVDVTQEVATACDGSFSCYFDATALLGDFAFGCAKEFDVEWSCGDDTLNTAHIAEEWPLVANLECALPEMVNVCHKAGKKGKTITLYINHAAVAAHVRHGDTEGECGGEPPLEF
jgi:hypothetical protein